MLVYIGIVILGLVLSYIADVVIYNRHKRNSLQMINKMFDDTKKVMYTLILILSLGFIRHKENDTHEDN